MYKRHGLLGTEWSNERYGREHCHAAILIDCAVQGEVQLDVHMYGAVNVNCHPVLASLSGADLSVADL